MTTHMFFTKVAQMFFLGIITERQSQLTTMNTHMSLLKGSQNYENNFAKNYFATSRNC